MSEQERIAGQFLGATALGQAAERPFPPTPTPEEIAEWRKKEEEQRKAYKEQQRKQARNELRDRFAMAALTGLLACPNSDGTQYDYAKWVYQYADAMLKARGENSQ